MEAMRTLLDEHQSLAAIIHAIRHMIGEIRAGRLTPDFKLFEAMVHYLDAYPEKRHHPKEDRYLFEPLKARTSEGAEVLARLEREHAEADARIKTLEQALDRYVGGAPDGFETFAQAFDAYAEFYRNHMLTEEREVLPLLIAHFTEEDWARADAGIRAEMDPMGGTRPGGKEEDFARIFSKLVAAAPPPIGFGSGPYKND
ncbi:MAG: hemerythrin domain-containing protein [Thauera phenolivorans]|uniref:Hemerythrin domain-containing protein n=1 Tax=Thauera phenolivorans TaxID=1792543 RepID=A0A7X7R886_9RHOO|nr:hemerythrin domain-containing protein [Thauera phenolivorans]NLF54133.1 hemerythrin domain-containing protein [Thauera phenolivorans]